MNTVTNRLLTVLALLTLFAFAGCASQQPRGYRTAQPRHYYVDPPALNDPSKFGGDAAYPYGRRY